MTLEVIEVVMIILTNRISNTHDICHIYVASFLYCKCVVHWNCGTTVQPPPLATTVTTDSLSAMSQMCSTPQGMPLLASGSMTRWPQDDASVLSGVDNDKADLSASGYLRDIFKS